MKKNHVIAVTVLVAASLVSGCASTDFYDPGPSTYPATSQSYPAPTQSYSSVYGVVDSIQMTQASGNGNSMGVGAVVGGVVGGLLGTQIGGGRGRTAATVAGAIGGAMVGNQVEQRNNMQSRDMYQIGVRLDSGSYQTVTQDTVADLRVGNRVRIENNRVYRY